MTFGHQSDTTITIRLPTSVKANLVAFCKLRDRSMTSTLIASINEYVIRHSEEGDELRATLEALFDASPEIRKLATDFTETMTSNVRDVLAARARRSK